MDDYIFYLTYLFININNNYSKGVERFLDEFPQAY